MTRGQAIVEFALVLPLLMFVLLAFGELAILAAWEHQAQRAADVLADAAAARISADDESWHAGWEPLAAEELVNAECESVDVTFPDETHASGDRVRVMLSCVYQWRLTRGLSGLHFAVTSEAVVPASAGS